jgi:hypothetical protein
MQEKHERETPAANRKKNLPPDMRYVHKMQEKQNTINRVKTKSRDKEHACIWK